MKKEYYLFINTVNKNHPSYIVFNGKGDFLFKSQFIDCQEEMAEKFCLFLKKNKIKKEMIRAVLVFNGPGSFSSSRAGVVFANSFNFLFKTPVVGIADKGGDVKRIILSNLEKLKRATKSGIAAVYYKRKPNITI